MSRWRDFLGWLAAALLLRAGLAFADGTDPAAEASLPQSLPPAQDAAVVSRFQERLLLVDINQQHLDQAVLVLEDKAGALYLWRQDLQRWRFRTPAANTAIEYQGEKYYPLSAIADVSHTYDRSQLSLVILVASSAFTETTRSSRAESIPSPVPPAPGAFINYDLVASHAPGATQRAGQFELGVFNRFGVGTGNVLVEDFGRHPKVTRLDTTWSVDFPEKLQTLRLGDAINVPGSWGRSLLFGGLQFGSNFGTQPAFVTFTPQTLAGQAVLPSTVDVFISNALVSHQTVPPGPFSIQNLPVLTGAGEVRLVVRDLLGREQIVVQPFYGSQSLLREGLASFSAEMGFVRENFGINSSDYGSWLSTGTYRRGLSEHFTGEIHGEAMHRQITAGVGGDYLLPQLGTLNAYIAGSQNATNHGGLFMLGMDRQAQPWSFGARTQWVSSGFSQVGLATTQMAPAQVSSVNLSHSAPTGGSIGMAYVWQHNRDQADSRIATLSYSLSLGKAGALGISAVRNLVGEKTTLVFMMLSFSFDSATSLNLSSQSLRGGSAGKNDQFTAGMQRNLPAGEGYGYRLQARSDKSAEASYTFQNNLGSYTVDAAQTEGSLATRLNASGGVAFLGGDIFPSRRIDESFAVVRIPDYPNVHVLADNQPAGQTDKAGNALLPRLRAYDRNVISIDQRDLPLDAEIKSLKLTAVPYFRSGMDLKFPIQHSRGATFSVYLENGQPLPAGAAVREVGQDTMYTVGYDGEVYVVGLGANTRLRANWGKESCEFEVSFIPGSDPLPDLGRFICKGVKP